MSFHVGLSTNKFFHFDTFEDFKLVSEVIGVEYFNLDGYYFTETRSCVDQKEYNDLVQEVKSEKLNQSQTQLVNKVLTSIKKDLGDFSCLELSYSS